MNTIKFGTDGWRAIIADDFTIENLKRVAWATALWVKEQKQPKPSVVVGYDCRFGGKMFAETSAKVFASAGIKVYLSKDFVSTPMVSLATKNLDASCGVIITASHNPPSYNGFKLKGSYGGPALPAMINEVEKLIPEAFTGHVKSHDEYVKEHLIVYHDFETDYIAHAESSFDLNAIRNSGIRIGYDGMYGAGQNAAKKLLPGATLLHCDFNPSFHGTAPEPIMKNLTEIAELIKKNQDIDFAFATDGDADRIGLLDNKGNFVDSHHIILMLIKYLHYYKKKKGKVVNSFSCTSKIGEMCAQFGIEQIVTKIGFKYICEFMIKEDVMVGGEESGGIAVTGHIPERDGIWIALTLLEYMAKTGKSLDDLIQDVYNTVGTFALERYDLHIDETLKQRIVKNCNDGYYISFGNYNIIKAETIDGFKYHLGKDKWVMIRASGTEPVLRIYAEAPNYAEAVKILNETKEDVLKG